MADKLTARGMDAAALERSILDKLVYAVGKDPDTAVARDWCVALSLAVRDRVVDRWMPSTRRIYDSGQKRVYYLSMEFLIGRLLRDTMTNLQIVEPCGEALQALGVDLGDVLAAEPDAALGNGGLGRLAACFLDSMATTGVAGFGYGIRYQHGLFRQEFERGLQIEHAEDWLTLGHPWEFERAEVSYPIDFGGAVSERRGDAATWQGSARVLATAFDNPITGWAGRQVNTLRLWSSKSARSFDLDSFNQGRFVDAAAEEVLAATISRVLYPNDSTPEGRELRLKQEYFFTAASIQDLLRRFLSEGGELRELPQRVAIQLNDTHPAIAVPELIRLLIDQHGLEFDAAFEISRGCIAYTNHTLMPEALEAWPVEMLRRSLPRHLELIERINEQVLHQVRRSAPMIEPWQVSVVASDQVRMGHLAFIGSHKVNGVSALHTELMQQTVFAQLNQLYPGRIVNQTNGITPRRWLLECNPALATLVSDTIGTGWITELEQLEALAPQAEDAGFRDAFAAVKQRNKLRLADEILSRTGLTVDPQAMFDVQIKRIHEYKRQLLNILEAVAHYEAIRRDPDADWQPRVRIFAGKAAPSYERAKLIIKLINDVAAVVNRDPLVGDRLKIAFLPNYNVTLAEVIIPAADLSEQISTAGMEASGTGNMKFALNGALTIGTLDGANVEISERVGEDNIFIFGLKANEVAAWRQEGYDPNAVIEAHPALGQTMRLIENGTFSPDEPDRFRAIVDDLRGRDHFMVAADFAAYAEAQRVVDAAFADRISWWRKAVLNTAQVGWFSSDRTIRGYAREIWQALPD